MNTSLKQQLSVVRLSLAVNNTLADVEYNENLLKEGVSKVTEYLNNLKLEINEKMNFFSAKIDIEGHILRVNNAVIQFRQNFILPDNSGFGFWYRISGIRIGRLMKRAHNFPIVK